MLLQRLSEQLASLSARRLIVGFSGGQDSQVLLAALLQLQQTQGLPKLSAIHINHHLQTQANAWQQHCESYCARHNIDLTVVDVSIEGTGNIEAKARDARFKAFAEHVAADDVLLLAQHLQDQSETVLYRLLRGAGVEGLSGIKAERQWQNMRVLRPLLSVDKTDIAAFADTHNISFVEDPSNQDTHYDRNYIRQNIMPVITKRWPNAAQSFQQAAWHQQEAQQLLNDLADIDLATVDYRAKLGCHLQPAFIDCQYLLALSPERQKNALRVFFHKASVHLSLAAWQSLMQLMQQGALKGRVHLSGWVLECFAGRVYILADSLTSQANGIWQTSKPWRQAGMGTWSLAKPQSINLSVKFRKGGETMQLNGQTQKVKKLFQQANTPPFQRDVLPFFYHEECLLAVGDVLLSDKAKALLGANVLVFTPEAYS